MRRKKFAALTLAAMTLAAGCILGGCQKDDVDSSTGASTDGTKPNGTNGTQGEEIKNFSYVTTETSSMFVYRDGSVISLEVDPAFDKDYYDVEELRKENVEPAIKEYNATLDKDGVTGENLPVSLVDLSAKDGTLSMRLDFQTALDYVKFNQSFNTQFDSIDTFIVCKISDAEAAGLGISGGFVDSEGSAVSSTKLKENYGDYYILAVNYGGKLPDGVSGLFSFEGEIAFVSNGLKIEGENSARLYESTEIQYVVFR